MKKAIVLTSMVSIMMGCGSDYAYPQAQECPPVEPTAGAAGAPTAPVECPVCEDCGQVSQPIEPEPEPEPMPTEPTGPMAIESNCQPGEWIDYGALDSREYYATASFPGKSLDELSKLVALVSYDHPSYPEPFNISIINPTLSSDGRARIFCGSETRRDDDGTITTNMYVTSIRFLLH